MKILVVRLSSLGDILHLFPAISDLHRNLPDAEIHWLVEPAFAELAGWHSAVKKVIAVPLRAHKKVWWKAPGLLAKLRKQLQAEHYDIVLDAQGLLKSALLARLAGAAVFGFDADSARESMAARFYRQTARIPDGLHVIEKNRQLVAALIREYGAACGAPESATISHQSLDFGLDEFRQRQLQAGLDERLREVTGQPYLVLLHGTTWNSKYWPESSWQELIRLLARQGLRCLLPWGNENERLRALRLQQAGGEQALALPKLSLSELTSVLLHARAFISVETGIGHLAAVLDVPGLMLHGPTDPEYSGILGLSCQHITSGVDCSPCFKRDCPKLDIPGGIPACQQKITAQSVYQQCLALPAINTAEISA